MLFTDNSARLFSSRGPVIPNKKMPVMADANGNIITDPLGVAPPKRSLAELNQPQTEKPLHYSPTFGVGEYIFGTLIHVAGKDQQLPAICRINGRYLKGFRVEQCPLFLKHNCNQHRPYSCFHWHFLNQRRRRPKKKKDGSFNYSPDHYCTLYNETTGECPNGEDCPFLHKVAGDVERRYHLRYYKTSLCVHETDSRGACVRNGAHCAFAHGPQDLRQPVYDIRELKMIEQEEKEGESKQVIPEDPRWNDTKYVLENYKTEPCKKPPRLCRQGYACPQYHNNRDRRRSPRKYKYRSTPCPNVKHGDEWGDPAACENGDSCAYCHTRTEQQFHPEIYKSTKCNDMQQTGHCPRGPFCAFAHVEQDVMTVMTHVGGGGTISIIPDKDMSLPAFSYQLLQRGVSTSPSQPSSLDSPLPSPAGFPQPISREQRSMSAGTYSAVAEHGIGGGAPPLSSSVPLYEKAPGSGRRSSSRDGDDRVMGLSQTSISSGGSEPRTPSKLLGSANQYYHASETIENVVKTALSSDLLGSDFDLDKFDDTSSLGSSLGGSAAFPMNSLGSEPLSIPGSNPPSSSYGSQRSQSPTSPMSAYYAHQGPGLLRSPTVVGSSASFFDISSPSLASQPLTSPLGLAGNSEFQRLSEENVLLKSKLASREESLDQAKRACDAWKREASHFNEAFKLSDRDKAQVINKLEAAEAKIQQMRHELETRVDNPHLHRVKKIEELDKCTEEELKIVTRQLKLDADKVEKILTKREFLKCTICGEHPRNTVTFPCAHLVMCEKCANNRSECPFCHVKITQKTLVSVPI